MCKITHPLRICKIIGEYYFKFNISDEATKWDVEFVIIAKKYRIVKKEDYYCIQSYDVSVCPECKAKLKVRGSKKRWVIDKDGIKKCYSLRQLQCMECKKIHIEYIDTIIPYKHYSAEAIQDALTDSSSSCVAENSTIRGWKRNGVRIWKT